MRRSAATCDYSAGRSQRTQVPDPDGATDARGTAVRPIYGLPLDGTLPGNKVIVYGSVSYARAIGHFLPGTWAWYASDGDRDGVADPQNLYDSTLAAARYLCSGGLDLRDPSQVLAAILRYNNSMPYARNVLGWAGAYATGVIPVDLPPVTGPAPPLGDIHLENPEGIGPGLPLKVKGLPSTDPLAQTPLIDLSPSGVVNPGSSTSRHRPLRPPDQGCHRRQIRLRRLGRWTLQPAEGWTNRPER